MGNLGHSHFGFKILFSVETASKEILVFYFLIKNKIRNPTHQIQTFTAQFTFEDKQKTLICNIELIFGYIAVGFPI